MIFGSRAEQLEIHMPHPPLSFFISGTSVAWMRHAACKGADRDVFFADEQAKRRGLPAEVPAEAEVFCGSCSVQQACLDYARQTDAYGIWGNTTRQQREALDRPIVRAKCPGCQGANLFRAGAEQVCAACGKSWLATKIHGNASAPVDLTPASPNVIPLVVPAAKPVYAQDPLFDVSGLRSEPCRRKRVRRKPRVSQGEQLPIPGVDPVVRPLRRHAARTSPTTPRRAAAA